MGRAGDAVAAGEAAIRLNPHHPDWYLATLGIARFVARDFAPAVTAMERAPDALCDTRAWLAPACAHAGEAAAAERHGQEFVRYCSEHFGSDPKSELPRYMEWLVEANTFLRPEDATFYVEGLRKAGLPA